MNTVNVGENALDTFIGSIDGNRSTSLIILGALVTRLRR